jgi:hypothetical protein
MLVTVFLVRIRRWSYEARYEAVVTLVQQRVAVLGITWGVVAEA